MSIEELEHKGELIQQLVYMQADYINELHRIVLELNKQLDECKMITKRIQSRFEAEANSKKSR